MNKKSRSTLVQFAEDLTSNEMFIAPELPALMALDANLLAVVRLLEFQNPFFPARNDNDNIAAGGIEEHIADSICILANALRKNLSAYYAAIHESEDQCMDQEEVLF